MASLEQKSPHHGASKDELHKLCGCTRPTKPTKNGARKKNMQEQPLTQQQAIAKEKQSIADNIVGFTNGTGNLSKEAYSFVLNWILTGPNEKTKAYFDIWDKVLDAYLPSERPILFRSCPRITQKPIQSFSGSISAVERFSNGHKGHVLICDTNEYMRYLDFQKESVYYRNFFPIYHLIKKDLATATPHFRKEFYEQYKGEDEYIVRVDYNYLYDLKWSQKQQ